MASQYARLDSTAPGRKGQVAGVVFTEPSSFDTRTPSNSVEAISNSRRPLQFSDSSDESRCNSLNDKKGSGTTVVQLQGLNTLLFGALQALCQQPGVDTDAAKELSQLAAMASKVPAQDAASAAKCGVIPPAAFMLSLPNEEMTKYRKDLQYSCHRMASTLPAMPRRRLESGELCFDPYAELGSRPIQTLGANGHAPPESPFTSSASKVIIPRNPSTASSRASSTLSHVSSRRSSRVRQGPNPFEAANSSSSIIEEGNEEEEVAVEEVVTPGGTCREVLVRREFDYLVDNPEGMFQSPVPGKGTREVPPSMRSVPPKLPDRQQPALADGAQPAGRKAISGQLREADVAQAISNAGLKSEVPSTSGDAANPFATIRAVVTPAVPRKAGPPLHDEGATSGAQEAAPRSASDSAPLDESARAGKGLALEAPSLNRISDPSPHSSASGSAAGRSLRQGDKRTASLSQTSSQQGQQHAAGTLEAGGRPNGKGAQRSASPEKAKSGCWCF